MNKASRLRSFRPLLPLVGVLLATGCASFATPAPAPQTGFVDQQMGKTIASVEQSLQVLVALDRGDEGPRKANALGTTVAGAAGPDLAPVAMPVQALPASPLGQQRIEQARVQTRQDLDTRVRLAWTGTAEDLLRELSTRVGFRFDRSGAGPSPMIHVDYADATVEQVLREVALQIDAAADIKVDTATREVSLVYKTR